MSLQKELALLEGIADTINRPGDIPRATEQVVSPHQTSLLTWVQNQLANSNYKNFHSKKKKAKTQPIQQNIHVDIAANYLQLPKESQEWPRYTETPGGGRMNKGEDGIDVSCHSGQSAYGLVLLILGLQKQPLLSFMSPLLFTFFPFQDMFREINIHDYEGR